MKCKIIKLKHEYDSSIPRIEEFETIKEIKGHSLYNLIQNNVNKSDCWMLITSNDHGLQNNLYRIFPDHSYTSLGKLQPSVETKNSSLTFETLRNANIQRLPEFKNSKGEPAHSKEDGSDWSPAQWLQAVIGELGEYANVMKKVERGDLSFEEAKPLIEKELADVMTYLDILAFRMDVDLSKAVQEKFNEVSERVGCSLRIENNEVVRKPDMNKTYGFVLPTYSQAVNYAKLGSGELTTFSINNRKSFVSTNSEESKLIEFEIEKEFECSGKCGVESLQVPTVGTITNITVQTTNSTINKNITLSVSENDEIKVSVNPKMTDEETQENSNRMEKYKSSAKQIASNWIGTSKISNTTRAKIEDLIEKDILDIKKSIYSESGKVSNIELILNAALMGVKFGDATKLKVSQLIKNDLEEFKAAKEACRIPKEQRKQLFTKRSFSSNIGGALNEMIRWKLFKNYAEIYPLKIPHNAIDDVYSFEFQGIDNGKQYLFYHAKRIFLAKDNMNLRVVAIAQSNLFSFFSKQLGTKIAGMLINGSRENAKLNPGDLIQFYDDRNVLYNFRLVKSSDKNVEVSLS